MRLEDLLAWVTQEAVEYEHAAAGANAPGLIPVYQGIARAYRAMETRVGAMLRQEHLG